MEIIAVTERQDLFEKAAKAFWEQWGNESNYKFYKDCMIHSTTESVPSFYIAVDGDSIIGTYAILRNDLVSRQDLSPWLACLYVDPAYRGQAMGSKLMDHAIAEANKKGYDKLYLTTDHIGYYEKYGWSRLTECYDLFGNQTSVYEKKC
ncbi:GNAT family N-acetyltransferase [Sporosarcina thermotolerans]|uniref:GNAT family N-acetyltransferase n=1 Tax=Sporosarcina thermotolerans TaxID=633404 RepID=A0AAW9A6M0_9BACL|nr:GNAT family N-acetyltransferase [Sporosarcina thermotolerans]MDW0115935.1 GNAT family N-acetyltransferase [Sporosarcina thermotolerans]WHT46849.1 GNAT family N-acetyltransferase [Sporosarcina thermotolerans]